MDCPNGLRECPNGWSDCSLCAFWNNQYKICVYVPVIEPVEPEPELIPELQEHELTTDLGIPIPSERGTWSERLNAMSEDERWAEYYKYHPHDLISKEPTKCMAGAIVPGGGGKIKTKKDTKGNKPTVYKWGEFK